MFCRAKFLKINKITKSSMEYENSTRLLYRAYKLLEGYPNRKDPEYTFTPNLSFEQHWVLYDDVRDLLFPVTKHMFSEQPRLRNETAQLLMRFTKHYDIMTKDDKMSAEKEMETFTKSCTWLELPVREKPEIVLDKGIFNELTEVPSSPEEENDKTESEKVTEIMVAQVLPHTKKEVIDMHMDMHMPQTDLQDPQNPSDTPVTDMPPIENSADTRDTQDPSGINLNTNNENNHNIEKVHKGESSEEITDITESGQEDGSKKKPKIFKRLKKYVSGKFRASKSKK